MKELGKKEAMTLGEAGAVESERESEELAAGGADALASDAIAVDAGKRSVGGFRMRLSHNALGSTAVLIKLAHR